MDEHGVSDVDDLEVSFVHGANGSDQDSARSVSKRTPNGQKEDRGLPRTSIPKRSSSFGKSPSTSSVFAPVPQPRTSKISFQTPGNGEDSNSWISPGSSDHSHSAENTQDSLDFEEHQDRVEDLQAKLEEKRSFCYELEQEIQELEGELEEELKRANSHLSKANPTLGGLCSTRSTSVELDGTFSGHLRLKTSDPQLDHEGPQSEPNDRGIPT